MQRRGQPNRGQGNAGRANRGRGYRQGLQQNRGQGARQMRGQNQQQNRGQAPRQNSGRAPFAPIFQRGQRGASRGRSNERRGYTYRQRAPFERPTSVTPPSGQDSRPTSPLTFFQFAQRQIQASRSRSADSHRARESIKDHVMWQTAVAGSEIPGLSRYMESSQAEMREMINQVWASFVIYL